MNIEYSISNWSIWTSAIIKHPFYGIEFTLIRPINFPINPFIEFAQPNKHPSLHVQAAIKIFLIVQMHRSKLFKMLDQKNVFYQNLIWRKLSTRRLNYENGYMIHVQLIMISVHRLVISYEIISHII